MRANSSGARVSSSHRIVVIGLGHVGLPTALGLCSLGWNVAGADQDEIKVAMIGGGKSPFFEPGVDDLLQTHLTNRRFQPTSDVAKAVSASDVVFVCVGTPQREDGGADVSQIEAIARLIGRNLHDYKLIVEKSTVPAVTALRIKRTIQQSIASKPTHMESGGAGDQVFPSPLSCEALFDVASNPEFLREGRALEDFFRPNRIVLGVESERALTVLQEIYAPIECPKVVTDLTTAELIKHASNSFLSTKISFMNMVADVCDAVGADVTKVAEGLGLDPRIAPGFLQAGIGFGGYCFPKDLRAFRRLAEDHNVECSLLRAVEKVNCQRVEIFLQKIRSCLWVAQGKPIGVLGLAFKPGTDDIREAPGLKIIDGLLREGAELRLYDPRAMAEVKRFYPPKAGQITYVETPYEVAAGAEALLLLTEWDEFKHLDWERLRDLMAAPNVIDGRNFLDPAMLKEAGFTYLGMGRYGDDPLRREFAVPATASLSGLGRQEQERGIHG